MDVPHHLMKGMLADPLDIRQVFFSNLQLLGFNADLHEKKYRIAFNKDMFSLQNKKGFEVVMHFLFSKLNAVRSKDTFRDCWPVNDKKNEQQFRKMCTNWLTEISKEDPSARLPRIVPSMFMSPGGDKFYHLLFSFSSFVLLRVAEIEHGLKAKEHLRPPVLTRQNMPMSSVMAETLECASIRHHDSFLEHTQEACLIQNEWRTYASELVRENRGLNKEIRELEREVKLEIQKSAEQSAARGSPMTKGRSGLSEFDVRSVKRAEKVQEVRNLWKTVSEFHEALGPDREIVESILHGTLEKYKLDATELNVRVPDLLLRECEQEIQRRSVDNIYKGGKLNLLSVVHLWNLSLHLYIEKLHQAGVPNFEASAPMVTTLAHTHHAHLTNAKTLRTQLKEKMIPELKQSISGLRERLDSQILHSPSTDGIRSTISTPCCENGQYATTMPIGLGMLPPTPPVNFSTEGVEVQDNSFTNPMPNIHEYVSTPEGASQIMENIQRQVRAKQMSPLTQGSPVYAPRLAIRGQPAATNNMSQIPRWDRVEIERAGNKQRTRVRSARNAPAPTHPLPPEDARLPQTTPVKVKATASGTQIIESSPQESGAARQSLTAQTDKDSVFKVPPTSTRKVRKSQKSGNNRQTPQLPKTTTSRTPNAHDILADQIAESVLSGLTPKGSGSSAVTDFKQLNENAFQSKDKLARTPLTQPPKVKTWHDTLFQDSIGPLSSTRIEHHPGSVNMDRVAQRLFSDDCTDEEEVGTKGQKFDTGHKEVNQSHNSTLQAASSQSGGDTTLQGSQNSSIREPTETLNSGNAVPLTPAQITQNIQLDNRAEQLVDLMLSMHEDVDRSREEDDDIKGNVGLQDLSNEPARDLLEWSDHDTERGGSGSEKTSSDHADLERIQELSPGSPRADISIEDIINANSVYDELMQSETPQLPRRVQNERVSNGLGSAYSPLAHLSNNNNSNSELLESQDVILSKKSSPIIKRHLSPMKKSTKESPGLGLLDMDDDDLLTSLTMPTGPDLELIKAFSVKGKLNFDEESQSDVGSGQGERGRNFQQLEDEDNGCQSTEDEDMLIELANTSARVIEFKDGNYRESIEVSPAKKLSEYRRILTNTEPPKQEMPASSGSTTQELMARLQRLKLQAAQVTSNAEAIGTSKITENKRDFEESVASPRRERQHGDGSDDASVSQTSSFTKLSFTEKYLQRTPVKKSHLESKFVLDLDAEDEENRTPIPSVQIKDIDSTVPVRSGKATSPLDHDWIGLDAGISENDLVPLTPPSVVTTFKKNLFSLDSPKTPVFSSSGIPMSPLTSLLHGEDQHQIKSSRKSLPWQNIMDEDDSVLLPSSPPEVGQLLDL